jgi:hypothetical protein
MTYSELVYFDGAHFAHIVARAEYRRLYKTWLNTASLYALHRRSLPDLLGSDLSGIQPLLHHGALQAWCRPGS